MNQRGISGFFDFIWVIALMAYVFAGMATVPFHADESTQIYLSRDYWDVMREESLEPLVISEPYGTYEQARLTNGILNPLAIGFAWETSNLRRSQLPNTPWDWEVGYAKNVSLRTVPNDTQLHASRLPSTIALMFSVPLMYALGRLGGGRLGGFIASGLFALDPVLLIEGRRALGHGGVLFLGLLTLIVAINIASARANKQLNSSAFFVIVFSVLALATDTRAVVFVVPAIALTLVGSILRPQRKFLFGDVLSTVFNIMIIVVGFVVLSPVLWDDQPLQRVDDVINQRQALIDWEVERTLDHPLTDEERNDLFFNQPFITPPQYFDDPVLENDPDIAEQITAYEESSFSGIQWGEMGVLPMTLSLFGFFILLFKALKAARLSDRVFAIGMLLFLAAVYASLMVNPLPTQEYYLAQIALACILAGSGVGSFVDFNNQRRSDAITTETRI